MTPTQLQSVLQILEIRDTALAEFDRLGPCRQNLDRQQWMDRINDVAWANRALERLADRLGLSPADLISQAQDQATFACLS